jgi:hypothetical protein
MADKNSDPEEPLTGIGNEENIRGVGAEDDEFDEAEDLDEDEAEDEESSGTF